MAHRKAEDSYKAAEENVKQLYDQSYSKNYRSSDERAVKTKNHAHVCNILNSLAASFDYQISILDVGCGSGRHFHCLTNARSLTGIDVSPFMIEEAKNPVLQNEVSVKDIELICGNIFDADLPECTFDFAYSSGVLGEHAPMDLAVCEKIFRLLRNNGLFFFTVVDKTSKTMNKTLKRRAVEFVYPILPSSLKRVIDKRFQSFYMSREELDRLMAESSFQEYKIDRHISMAPNWKGAHFECVAHKIG